MEFVIGLLLGCILGSTVTFLCMKLYVMEKPNGQD